MNQVALIMGSDSDLAIAEKAAEVLNKLEIKFEMRVMSAHRTPDKVIEFAKNAKAKNFGVIIAIAGKAAHLAGFIAANTRVPVIGVPVKSQDLGGLDALLATVQMPSGVPVATVAIDGGANAAWLAARILALSNEDLALKLEQAALNMAAEVEAKDLKIKN